MNKGIIERMNEVFSIESPNEFLVLSILVLKREEMEVNEGHARIPKNNGILVHL